ncbi:MAG: hypothetical protein ABSG68_20560 [Thermoguttaceae bacterium]|jgi:hypothetical protein
MHISFCQYQESMTEEVVRFNKRLQAGGLTSRFPETPIPAWLPAQPGSRLFQQYFLAADEANVVRGGYILKQQDFWIAGKVVAIADLRLPISEGAVSRSYAPVGSALLLDAQRKQPLLFGLGIGGYEEPLTRLLAAAGWSIFTVPFFFRVAGACRFLRNLAHLRTTPLRRSLLDFLAVTGLGPAAIRAAQAWRGRRTRPDRAIQLVVVNEFGPWADDVWEAGKHRYGMTAVRDAATLRLLYPAADPRFLRLKMLRQSRPVGWAVVLNTQLSAHKQFGNLRLGSVVDCFSDPDDAPAVVGCATGFLEQRKPDLIVSNQSHAAWCRAFDGSGFLRGPSNFLFAASRELTQVLRAGGVASGDIHVNRGDGDGPVNL